MNLPVRRWSPNPYAHPPPALQSPPPAPQVAELAHCCLCSCVAPGLAAVHAMRLARPRPCWVRWRQSRHCLPACLWPILGTWKNKKLPLLCVLLCRDPGSGPAACPRLCPSRAPRDRHDDDAPSKEPRRPHRLHHHHPRCHARLPFDHLHSSLARAQPTAPPLCWSKPSRTPADSEERVSDRVCCWSVQ